MAITHNPPELGMPPSYSNGIEVRSGARTLYIAGQVGWDAAGKIEQGIAAQTERAFANMRTVLRSAGMDLANIVKTTIYMTNLDDYPEYARVRSGILGDVKPASTLVVIKQLVKPELLVEIEATAVAD
jgi:enamine deaminase RidA (YjgF/YER057c/UK114 family)